jgi:ABC-2 type transport system permease protein
MSAESNVVSDSRFGADAVAATRMAVTRPFYWSVRRELWENRSVYLPALVAAGLVVVGVLFGGFRGRGMLLSQDAEQQQMIVAQQINFTGVLIMGVTFVVAVFYCLDALYGERRDRSVLFWRSLPVSDTVTVLAKASVPLVILPLLTFVIAAVTQWIVVLVDMAMMAAHGYGVSAIGQLPVLQMQAGLLYHLVTVHSLWYAPIYAWFLLVSAWARRAPFLWAFLPPLAISIVEMIAFNTKHFSHFLGDRFSGGSSGVGFGGKGALMIHPMSGATPGQFFTSPGLWGGLVVAAIFLAGAVQLRRYRSPS